MQEAAAAAAFTNDIQLLSILSHAIESSRQVIAAAA